MAVFPYGMGGIGSTKLSDKEHKRHLLMYHDKRFQVDINFPFVAFSHEQVKATTSQSFLLVDKNRFGDITKRLMGLDQSVLSAIIERLAKDEHVKPASDEEKACFQVIKDLDHVAGQTKGSTTSKKYMQNEIWSLISSRGGPLWYITLSPADIQHPICIYYAGSNEKFSPSLLPYDEHLRSVCRNPVAGARFFHFLVETFITDVLGVNSDHRGLYGDTDAYYGTVEQQGRLTLHLHMLLWISGALSPQEMRERIMSSDSIWKEKIVQWLESCHTGDFVDESKEEVLERVAAESKAADYVDPTQSLPVVPPLKCSQHQVPLSDCKPCTRSKGWWEAFKHTVNDLLSKSNIHDCNRNINKDGTRRKNRASGTCTNNRWGKCKAHFPRPLFSSTKVDPDTGAIDMKKTEPWINTFSPVVTFIFRCNTDITSLSSGTAIKSVVLYISDYITKTSLKTHTIFESIRSVFHKNSEMIGGTLLAKEKARRVMTKVVNLLTAKMEMGAPMICMYLLGNPDHYTDHKFVTFYWQSYVSEARRAFIEVGIAEGHKIAIIKKNGRLIGLSPVFDYIYRSPELENVNLYDWITQFKKVKLPKSSSKRDKEGKDLVSLTTDDAEDFSPDVSFTSFASENSEIRPEADVKSTPVKLSKNMFRFTNEHPLHATHALQRLPVDHKRIPNFVGANLPRCDQGDREYYCSTMLVLFKAWRTGNDLRLKDLSWDESFSEYNFSERDVRIMKNSNIRYECLDARDDYRAQLKKGSTGLANIFGSWDEANDDVELDECQPTAHMEQEYEDVPLENIGHYQRSRLLNMQTMSAVLSNTGWLQEKVTQITVPPFKPSIIQSGSEWQATVLNRRQQVLDQRNENNTSSKHPNISGKGPAAENIVKIVDKSYLERTFTAKEGQCNVDDTVKRFKLNKEQEQAFKIVANHASSKYSEQLKMYIGGMGGTGKSQVLKALSHFFALRNESH